MIEKYKDYEIYHSGDPYSGLNYCFQHESFEGVYEYDGETGEPSEYDYRCGYGRTIQDCKEQIDELTNN